MSSTPPHDRTPGKLLKTGTFNELLAYLRQNRDIPALDSVNEQDFLRSVRLIVRVKTGGPAIGGGSPQADLTYNSYWGSVLYIVSQGTSDMGVDLWEEPTDSSEHLWVPFVSLAEQQGVSSPDTGDPISYAGPHAIPIGSILEIFPRHDVDGTLRWVSFTLPRQVVMVRVTSNATGGGMYWVKEQIPKNVDISSTVNASDANVGTDGPTTCLLMNPSEYGASSHDLEAGKVYVAYLIRLNSDGTPVYLLTGTGGESTPPISTAGLKYQVWMTVDDVGTKAWDWPRWKD